MIWPSWSRKALPEIINELINTPWLIKEFYGVTNLKIFFHISYSRVIITVCRVIQERMEIFAQKQLRVAENTFNHIGSMCYRLGLAQLELKQNMTAKLPPCIVHTGHVIPDQNWTSGSQCRPMMTSSRHKTRKLWNKQQLSSHSSIFQASTERSRRSWRLIITCGQMLQNRMSLGSELFLCCRIYFWQPSARRNDGEQR